MAEFDLAALRATRVANPGAIASALATRRRPQSWRGTPLFLLAADHSARGALGVGNRPTAMASRSDLLDRLAIALQRPGVDGVLATPDIVDDLALLGLLDDKVVAGSMNRGGLQGAAFEMDDRFTAFDVDGIVRSGLDFGKLLLRINLADPGSVRTMESAAAVVTHAAKAGLPVMIEPFLSRWEEGRVINDLTSDAVIKSVAISSALGASSAYTWLKLPVVPDMERVLDASTLPILLLGGDRPDLDADEVFDSWAAALALPGVQGLVVGRALLYPPDDDVAGAVDRAASLVHPRRLV